MRKMLMLVVLLVATTSTLSADWSPEAAARYLDGRQKEWFSWKPAMSADGQMVISPDLRASLMRDADARLRQRLATGATRNRGEEAALLTGPIAVSIVEDAQSHAVDLILMATHGRGGMAHLLLGSVAERVVRTAPCPVMTVRPHLPAARATGAAASAGASHV